METGSLPWKAMFRYLEAIGGKRCRKDMCSAVLSELESLLAYDMGYLFLFDVRGRLSCCETRRVDERRKRQYFDYYMRIDPCRRATPISSGCMHTDWSRFCDTEFYTDFGRPQGVRYSAGMQLHRDNGSLLGVLFLTRSGARGFGPCELALLEALCPQVENLLLLVCAAEERLLLAAGGAGGAGAAGGAGRGVGPTAGRAAAGPAARPGGIGMSRPVRQAKAGRGPGGRVSQAHSELMGQAAVGASGAAASTGHGGAADLDRTGETMGGAAGGAALLELLSPRERQIAGLLCRGYATKAIASSLLLTPATVYRHVSNIFEKAEVHSRAELVARLYGTRER